jgi:hypothetical protein
MATADTAAPANRARQSRERLEGMAVGLPERGLAERADGVLKMVMIFIFSVQRPPGAPAVRAALARRATTRSALWKQAA